MGCYDTVHALCRQCGGEMEIQSKAGDCMLQDFDLSDAPPAILGDLHGETLACRRCHTVWRFRVITIAQLERT